MSRSTLIRFALATGSVAALAVLNAPAPQARQRDQYVRVRCESQNGHEQFCSARIDGDVRLVRQLSNTDCRENRNWRWERNGITVRDGCRAEFEYRTTISSGWTSGGSSGSNGGWSGWDRGSSGYNRDRVTCQSMDRRESACPAPIGGDVRVARVLGKDACIEGRSWNWSRDGVRVWSGCQAEFEFRRRDGEVNMNRGYQRVTCQGQKDREQFCPAPIDGDVRLLRVLGDVRCMEGRNWSWTQDGVRVWEGCRAEFEFRPRS